MLALHHENGRLQVVERPDPQPRAGEALLRVRLAGICNTDLEIARGYMGFSGILGHEVVAEVESLGPAREAPPAPATTGLTRAPLPSPVPAPGARVAVEINCACERCDTCRRGERNHCPKRTVLGILGRDGTLAERLVAPVANLHVLPGNVSDEAAVFVEPLAAAFQPFEQVQVDADDRIALLGDGKLGLLLGMAITARGLARRAVAIGRHPEKLAILAALGLRVALESDPVEAGFDVVLEATGSPTGLARALALVRPRGTLVLKSTYAGAPPLDLAPIVIQEVRVLGSRCGPFAVAIDALGRGAVDPTPLLAARYPLRDAVAAFERARRPGTLKVVVDPRA
ncbi:MAG: alcohol dehydrogenase catalytic domain-containing protein [Planctomycetes bacterium]|nr:alcohol dehydrogenase catalytic domain-containing protein [Planctomycetota bacterium]